ncbi:hypothetical protein D3C83_306590 [compost metagenome]
MTVYDAAFGAEMQRVFEQDLQQARPYELADFNKRSAWERLSELVALPFHSQL